MSGAGTIYDEYAFQAIPKMGGAFLAGRSGGVNAADNSHAGAKLGLDKLAKWGYTKRVQNATDQEEIIQ
jgi:hypothetical protein